MNTYLKITGLLNDLSYELETVLRGNANGSCVLSVYCKLH